MLTNQSPLVQRTFDPLEDTCARLRDLSDLCWGQSDSIPVESVDPQVIDELGRLLSSAQDWLNEIQSASDN